MDLQLLKTQHNFAQDQLDFLDFCINTGVKFESVNVTKRYNRHPDNLKSGSMFSQVNCSTDITIEDKTIDENSRFHKKLHDSQIIGINLHLTIDYVDILFSYQLTVKTRVFKCGGNTFRTIMLVDKGIGKDVAIKVKSDCYENYEELEIKCSLYNSIFKVHSLYELDTKFNLEECINLSCEII